MIIPPTTSVFRGMRHMSEEYRKTIRTTCPVCARELTGTEHEEDGKIFLVKRCPEHGEVSDLVSSDARLYRDKMGGRERNYHSDCSLAVCSQGICKNHLNREAEWGFIEVTTRCNMKCPVCYADSEARGRDVPIEDIKRIIDHIAGKGNIRQFILIGGEPTVRDDLFEILDYIREKGLIRRAYLATNGLNLVDFDYCRRLRETGLKRLELAFDSTDPDICRQIRGSLAAYNALPTALDNLRKLQRIRVQLTITVVKGRNDRTLRESLEFALKNSDIVKQVIISPQQFCGRLVETQDLHEKRLTLECIEKMLREQFGFRLCSISMEAGLSLVEPLRRMGIMNIDKDYPTSIHPRCASFGMVGRTWKGDFFSLAELAFKKRINPYDVRDWANGLSERIACGRARAGRMFGRGLPAKLAWFLAVGLSYLPRYILKILRCTRPKLWLSLAASPFRKVFRRTSWRAAVFGPEFVWLMIIFLGDEFNFSWERLPYCMDFQYMIHPRTGEVTKVPTCLYISHRQRVTRSQETGSPA